MSVRPAANIKSTVFLPAYTGFVWRGIATGVDISEPVFRDAYSLSNGRRFLYKPLRIDTISVRSIMGSKIGNSNLYCPSDRFALAEFINALQPDANRQYFEVDDKKAVLTNISISIRPEEPISTNWTHSMVNESEGSRDYLDYYTAPSGVLDVFNPYLGKEATVLFGYTTLEMVAGMDIEIDLRASLLANVGAYIGACYVPPPNVRCTITFHEDYIMDNQSIFTETGNYADIAVGPFTLTNPIFTGYSTNPATGSYQTQQATFVAQDFIYIGE